VIAPKGQRMDAGRLRACLLPLLATLLIGCGPSGTSSAQALRGATPVPARPLALLVLTPGVLPPRPSAPAPVASPLPRPRPTRSVATVFASTPVSSPPAPISPFPSPSPVPGSGPTPSLTLTSVWSPPATRAPTVISPVRPAAHRPPDRIVAPAIGLDAPVTEVGWHLVERDGRMISEWDVADHAAGFHKGSAYPGHVGNTVLSGHHNIAGEVFRHLIELQPGDLIALYVGQEEYRYMVRRVLLVPEASVSVEQRRRNARWIGYFSDERLTLVSCWPYTGNTHRVIVVARPAEEGP